MPSTGFGQTQVGGIGSRPVEEQIVGFIATDDIKAHRLVVLDVSQHRHVKAFGSCQVHGSARGIPTMLIGVALESRDAGHEVPVQLLASGGIAEVAWGGTLALALGTKVIVGTEGHLATNLAQDDWLPKEHKLVLLRACEYPSSDWLCTLDAAPASNKGPYCGCEALH